MAGLRRVYSLSPYFGEEEILEIKLAEQGPVVDVFCFLEAKQNHQGRRRDLTWNEDLAQQMSARFHNEIRYDAISLSSSMTPWEKEGHQRERLGYLADDCHDDDLIIISDLDEVLRADIIRELRAGTWTLPAQIAFPIHPYRLDWQWTLPVESGWCQCTAVNGEQFAHWGAQGAVKSAHKFTVLTGNYGWHFTYQGDAERIVHKAKSIADGWTGELATVERAQQAIAEGVDVFGRDRPVRAVPMEELPVWVRENQARFRHLLRGGEDGQEEV